MAQNVSDEVKLAFRISPIKRKYKCTIDWITKGDTPGTITADQWNATYFGKGNVNNGETFARYKPFILSDSMRLGDNVRLLSNKYENGWLGANRSDVNGEFSPVEVASIIYDDVHTTTHITVMGSLYNYPINFDLYYRDSGDANWVLCENYTNRDSYITVYEFGSATNIKGWKAEIAKINLADMLACLVEVQVGFRDDVSMDLVTPFEIRKELEYQSEKSLPIGNISANVLNLKLNNTHQRYNPKNKDSDIYEYLKSNKVIRPYIGIDLVGSIVYIPQGVFYLRELKPGPDMTVDIYAVDRMLSLNEEDFISSTVYENYKNSELVKELIEDFGLGASEYLIDETDGTIPYAWFEPRRYAKNIKRLAIAEGGVAFFDEVDIFKYKKRGWTSEGVQAYYNDSHIIKDSAYSPLISRNMKNYIRIKSNPLYLQAEQQIYRSTEVISIAAGESESIVCYYSKIPCKEVQNAVVAKGANITIESEAKYAYATSLTFKNNGGAPEDVTSITIEGKPLEKTGANIVVSKNDTLISKYGKSEYSIDSEFIQEMDYAQVLADGLRVDYEDPEADLEFDSLSLPYLQLGDLIAVKCKKLNIGGKLF